MNHRSFYTYSKLLVWPLGILTIFSFLFLFYTQSQTEYLIRSDMWRLYEKLNDNASFIKYIFHNVHTFLIPTSVQYLDSIYSNGSLKLMHEIVFFASIVTMTLIYKIFRISTISKIESLTITFLFITLYFSLSNSGSFAYPMLDVLSIFTIISIASITLIFNKLLNTKIVSKWGLLFILISLLGFYSIETFVVCLFVLLIESYLLKKHQITVLISFILFLLITPYIAYQYSYVVGKTVSTDKDIFIIIKNFLLLLNGHNFLFFDSLCLKNPISIILSIFISFIELVLFAVLIIQYYLSKKSISSNLRFAILLASFSISAILLSTILRYSENELLYPVTRYSWFSILFTISILITIHGTFIKKNTTSTILLKVKNTLGIIIMIFIFMYAFLDNVIIGSGLGVKNISQRFMKEKIYMPIYVMHPKLNIPVGPRSAHTRYDVYDYLKKNNISMFSSIGYQNLGHKININDANSDLKCIIQKIKKKKDITKISLTMSNAINTIFFVDSNGYIKAYSEPIKIDFWTSTYESYLSKNVKKINIVYFNQKDDKYYRCIY